MNTKFVPKLSHPCSQDWNAMTGDDKRRFCEGCQLHVHNLSAMSHTEQQSLLAKRGVRQCVAYVLKDDSIQVRSGSWLLLQRLLYYGRAGMAFGLMVLTLGLSSCVSKAPKAEQSNIPDSQTCKPRPTPLNGRMVAGGITTPPPSMPPKRRFLFFREK